MALRLAKTEYGLVSGIGSGINDVTVFRSIPYAKPPVGELRWRPPQEPEPWEGILEAHTFRPMIAQAIEAHPFYTEEFYSYREPMSEGSLFLNIWTPAKDTKANLPVLFWIHGGGFQSGYSYEVEMDGDAFAKQGVILVTIEYRLGALGFLSHPDLSAETPYGCSGNWGLLDQIAALKWVRRNIRAFGGDPDRITIFGQSAGAMSVSHLIASPLTDGDIAGAIMQSGGGYNNEKIDIGATPTYEESERIGRDFLDYLQVDSIEEARKLPWEKIVEAQVPFEGEHLLFFPCVDGYSQTMKTYEAVEKNTIKQIPYIVGTTSNENGAYRFSPRQSRDSFRKMVQRVFGAYGEEFLELIGYDQDPDKAIDEGGLNDFLQPGMLAFADMQAKKENVPPTWLYYFNRNLPGERDAGAFHSAELWYVFQTLHRSDRPFQGLDYELANAMTTYWCNFAKYGDPNGEAREEGGSKAGRSEGGVSKQEKTKGTDRPLWTPYTKANRAGMELGERIGMLDNPGLARSRFAADIMTGKRHRV